VSLPGQEVILTNHSNEELINDLHEAICILSDTIGFNLEVIKGEIPERNIDAQPMGERLLSDGMRVVGESLELLRHIEQRLVPKLQ